MSAPIVRLGDRFGGKNAHLGALERAVGLVITVVDGHATSEPGAGHPGTLVVFGDGSTRFIARSRWRRLIGWLLCRLFGDHAWTTKAARRIPPSPAEIADGVAGFDRYRVMYCERCPAKYQEPGRAPKVASLMLALVLVAGLAACGGSTAPAARCHWIYTVYQDTTAKHTGGHLVPIDSVKKCINALDFT